MSTLRILIVDDHEAIRRRIRSLLASRSEWTVCGEAADGLEAVEKAKSLRPALVLMDVSLPHMGGVEAARIIRRDRPETAVIIVSQNDPKLLARQAAEVGAHAHISKSDLGRNLLRTIDKVVAVHATHDRQRSAKRAGNGIEAHAAEAEAPRRPAPDSSTGIKALQDLAPGSGPGERAIGLLAAIVDSSDDAIISKNLDGIITSWNRSAERIFGYTATEALGQHIMLIVPADRRNEEVGILERLRRGERVNHFQTIRTAKDGSRISVSLTISPVRDAAGRVVGASKVARDVTAQRRYVQELRESEERFRAIVETTPECVKVVAPDGTLLHMNASGLRMLAADSDATVIGKCVYELISPEDRERFRAFNESVCAGEKGSLEFEVIGFDGQRRQMESHAAPLRNADGTVVHLAVTRDVSERRRAEERERLLLAQSVAATAKFQAVFEQTSLFAGIMSNDGILVEVNRQALDACGYREDEVLGLAFWDTPWWREFKESRDNIRAATPLAARGTPYRETLRYSWADGTQRLVEFSLHPILDDTGRVCFLHPTGVDITDLKNAEERYRSLAETLESEVQARTREVAARNAEIVRQSAQLRALSWRLLQMQEDERRHIARELHDSAGQTMTVMGMDLAQLIDKVGLVAPALVADVAGVETTLRQLQQEIRTTSYLLHPPLLDDIGLPSALSWYVGGLAERTPLRVTLDIAEDFARLPRGMELVVFRIVQECLTNILRHSGSKTASVRIVREPERVTVAVKDSGCGIPREKLIRLQAGGSGVGIAGMHERLRQFDGTLAISSDRAGTQILMTIPIPASSPSLECPQPESTADAPPPNKATILKAAKRPRPGNKQPLPSHH